VRRRGTRGRATLLVAAHGFRQQGWLARGGHGTAAGTWAGSAHGGNARLRKRRAEGASGGAGRGDALVVAHDCCRGFDSITYLPRGCNMVAKFCRRRGRRWLCSWAALLFMVAVLGRDGIAGGGQWEGHSAGGKAGLRHARAKGTSGGSAAGEVHARSDVAPGGARTGAGAVMQGAGVRRRGTRGRATLLVAAHGFRQQRWLARGERGAATGTWAGGARGGNAWLRKRSAEGASGGIGSGGALVVAHGCCRGFDSITYLPRGCNVVAEFCRRRGRRGSIPGWRFLFMEAVLGRDGVGVGSQWEGCGAGGKAGPRHAWAKGTSGGGAAGEAHGRSDSAPSGARTRAGGGATQEQGAGAARQQEERLAR
jgi:hypothetical protein